MTRRKVSTKATTQRGLAAAAIVAALLSLVGLAGLPWITIKIAAGDRLLELAGECRPPMLSKPYVELLLVV
jgi:hypothetical protein